MKSAGTPWDLRKSTAPGALPRLLPRSMAMKTVGGWEGYFRPPLSPSAGSGSGTDSSAAGPRGKGGGGGTAAVSQAAEFVAGVAYALTTGQPLRLSLHWASR